MKLNPMRNYAEASAFLVHVEVLMKNLCTSADWGMYELVLTYSCLVFDVPTATSFTKTLKVTLRKTMADCFLKRLTLILNFNVKKDIPEKSRQVSLSPSNGAMSVKVSREYREKRS